MIPEHRLAYLLDEVKQSWISNCLYHNTATSPSLYVDHTCDRNDFPMKPYLELRNHKDEVWYLKYSHDGSKLASASKDNTVVIYDTTNYKPLFHLSEHDAGVAYVAWSPDDTKLITCCANQESSAKIWDMKVRRLFISTRLKMLTSTDWPANHCHQRFHLSMHERSMDTGRQACCDRLPRHKIWVSNLGYGRQHHTQMG